VAHPTSCMWHTQLPVCGKPYLLYVAHPSSYSMDICSKLARKWRWPLTSIKCSVKDLWSCNSNPLYVFMTFTRTNFRFFYFIIYLYLSLCYYSSK
jgi:hypothetical protein